MLVPDLADQFLQNVLHRHDAARAAIFVDHDRDVRLPSAILQQLADRLISSTKMTGDKISRSGLSVMPQPT